MLKGTYSTALYHQQFHLTDNCSRNKCLSASHPMSESIKKRGRFRTSSLPTPLFAADRMATWADPKRWDHIHQKYIWCLFWADLPFHKKVFQRGASADEIPPYEVLAGFCPTRTTARESCFIAGLVFAVRGLSSPELAFIASYGHIKSLLSFLDFIFIKKKPGSNRLLFHSGNAPDLHTIDPPCSGSYYRELPFEERISLPGFFIHLDKEFCPGRKIMPSVNKLCCWLFINNNNLLRRNNDSSLQALGIIPRRAIPPKNFLPTWVLHIHTSFLVMKNY